MLDDYEDDLGLANRLGEMDEYEDEKNSDDQQEDDE